MGKTRILESVSMLPTFLVIFLGPGASGYGPIIFFKYVFCISSCTSPLTFVQYNMADHFSVFICCVTKQYKFLKCVLRATSPFSGNSF